MSAAGERFGMSEDGRDLTCIACGAKVYPWHGQSDDPCPSAPPAPAGRCMWRNPGSGLQCARPAGHEGPHTSVAAFDPAPAVAPADARLLEYFAEIAEGEATLADGMGHTKAAAEQRAAATSLRALAAALGTLEEAVAAAIYDALRAHDPVGSGIPWVPGGTSYMQNEARRRARAALAGLAPERASAPAPGRYPDPDPRFSGGQPARDCTRPGRENTP